MGIKEFSTGSAASQQLTWRLLSNCGFEVLKQHWKVTMPILKLTERREIQ